MNATISNVGSVGKTVMLTFPFTGSAQTLEKTKVEWFFEPPFKEDYQTVDFLGPQRLNDDVPLSRVKLHEITCQAMKIINIRFCMWP